MNFEDVPWAYVLPVLVVSAFGVGTIYKRLQDRTVQVIRDTIKPGDLNVDELTAYAAKTLGKTRKGTDLGYL